MRTGSGSESRGAARRRVIPHGGLAVLAAAVLVMATFASQSHSGRAAETDVRFIDGIERLVSRAAALLPGRSPAASA